MDLIILFLPFLIFIGALAGLAWWLGRRLAFSFSSEGMAQRGTHPWVLRLALLVGVVWLAPVVLQLLVIGLSAVL